MIQYSDDLANVFIGAPIRAKDHKPRTSCQQPKHRKDQQAPLAKLGPLALNWGYEGHFSISFRLDYRDGIAGTGLASRTGGLLDWLVEAGRVLSFKTSLVEGLGNLSAG